MKILFKTKTSSKKEMIEKIDETKFLITVKETRFDEKADNSIVRAVGRYFNISSAKVRTISSHKFKQKIIGIS